MKIVHYLQGLCSPDAANGVVKMLYFLSREQAALGHEVTVICCAAPELIIPIEGVEVISLAWRWHDRRQPVVDLLKKLRPDVLHLHSVFIPRNIILARIARQLGIPVVLTPNGGLARGVRYRKPFFKLPFFWLLERPYLRRLAMLHSVGDEASFAACGVHVPVVIGYNSIDAAALPPIENQALLSELPGKRVDRLNLLFLGRLDIEHKGLDRLMDGMALYLKKHRAVNLLLAGPSREQDRERLEKMVGDYGIGDHVHFLGPVHGQMKWDLMRLADGFVLFSRWEGLSLSVLEALACNQLMLLSAAADPAGLVAKEEAGIVLPDPTPSAIAGALEKAAALSPSERAGLKERARRLAEENFSWKENVERLLEGYRRHCGVEEAGGRRHSVAPRG